MSAIWTRGAGHERVTRWPSCALCGQSVSAYGIDEETPDYVDIFVRCHGQRSGVRILKGPGYSDNQLKETLRELVFFAPSDAFTGDERLSTIALGWKTASYAGVLSS